MATPTTARSKPQDLQNRSHKHRRLRADDWWREISGYRHVTRAEFADPTWQLRHSVTKPEMLAELLGKRLSPSFLAELQRALSSATMALRVTPYILSLIDWDNPVDDPLRRQFVPLAREQEPDHPMSKLDALAEQHDAVAPGLTHRYPDKALLLALDVCPVYCCCCTRSYAIGGRTERLDEKCSFRAHPDRWEKALAYLRATPEVEDVVVSGGDLLLLHPSRLRHLGERLLDIPHIRRIRFATKGLAVLPYKVLRDGEWLGALTDIAGRGREQGVHVCVHTHFNHPNEITEVTRQACDALFQRSITVRNQSVLQRGVNDDADTMVTLVRRLAWINVEPYYVYLHDVVPGDETLRTSLADAVEIEKLTRGQTAGFMTPTFVCDTFGGGGKRELHSYELYDEQLGIAVYRSPVVDPDRAFFYFDPLRTLSPRAQRKWSSPWLRRVVVHEAAAKAGLSCTDLPS